MADVAAPGVPVIQTVGGPISHAGCVEKPKIINLAKILLAIWRGIIVFYNPMTAARPATTDDVAGRLALLAILLALAAAIALLPLRVVLLGAGATAAALLLLRWPWLALLPLAVLLPFTSGLRLGPLSVTDLLLAAAVALWFADGARRRTLRLAGSPVIVLTGVYLAVMTVSALGAADFGEAGREVIKWAELLVLLLVGPALLAPRQVPWLAAALVLGAVLQAFYGLYQFAASATWSSCSGGRQRSSGSSESSSEIRQ